MQNLYNSYCHVESNRVVIDVLSRRCNYPAGSGNTQLNRRSVWNIAALDHNAYRTGIREDDIRGYSIPSGRLDNVDALDAENAERSDAIEVRGSDRSAVNTRRLS